MHACSLGLYIALLNLLIQHNLASESMPDVEYMFCSICMKSNIKCLLETYLALGIGPFTWISENLHLFSLSIWVTLMDTKLLINAPGIYSVRWRRPALLEGCEHAWKLRANSARICSLDAGLEQLSSPNRAVTQTSLSRKHKAQIYFSHICAGCGGI